MWKTLNPTPPEVTDENVEMSVEVDMCLDSEVSLLINAERATSFGNFDEMNMQIRCLIPDEFCMGW